MKVGKLCACTFEDGTAEQHALVDSEVRESCAAAYASYQRLLAARVARDLAEKAEDFWACLMLTTYEAFNKNGRVSPHARGMACFLGPAPPCEGASHR